MDEISVEALERELKRREAIDNEVEDSFDSGDFLAAGMALFKKEGIGLIERAPSFVNKLLELEDRRLQQLALLQPKPLKDMDCMEIRAYLIENFLSSCINTAQTDKSAFLALLERFAQDEALKVALSSESYN